MFIGGRRVACTIAAPCSTPFAALLLNSGGSGGAHSVVPRKTRAGAGVHDMRNHLEWRRAGSEMLRAAHVLAHLKRLLASVANAMPTFNARGWFRQLHPRMLWGAQLRSHLQLFSENFVGAINPVVPCKPINPGNRDDRITTVPERAHTKNTKSKTSNLEIKTP